MSIKTYRQQKNIKPGFTIIETMLFIAVSGFLIVGVIVGTSSSIARQRYQDSVQDFAEFLRKTYSEVINVQNSRTDNKDSTCAMADILTFTPGATPLIDPLNQQSLPGRSNCAIYGKLLTVKDSKVRTYTLVGKATTTIDQTTTNISTPQAIKALGIDIITITKDGGNRCRFKTINPRPVYRAQWDAKIETTDKAPTAFTGAILILRSPLSGAVHTFNLKNKDKLSDNQFLDLESLEKTNYSCDSSFDHNYHKAQLTGKNTFHNVLGDNPDQVLKSEDIDFCLKSADLFAGSTRRNIRIKKGGYNSTAVEVVSAESDIFTTDQDKNKGNRCL